MCDCVGIESVSLLNEFMWKPVCACRSQRLYTHSHKNWKWRERKKTKNTHTREWIVRKKESKRIKWVRCEKRHCVVASLCTKMVYDHFQCFIAFRRSPSILHFFLFPLCYCCCVYMVRQQYLTAYRENQTI